MVKSKSKVDFDGRIYPTILEFNVNIDNELTKKAEFLFGAATLIIFFILNKVISLEFNTYDLILQISWIILLLGSFVSILSSMMIVLPRLRMFSRKERVKQDIFYYKNIKKFFSRKNYIDFLKDLPLDNKKISLAYSNQIYSLATNVLPFKFKLLKISGWVLLISIFTSIILFMFSLI